MNTFLAELKGKEIATQLKLDTRLWEEVAITLTVGVNLGTVVNPTMIGCYTALLKMSLETALYKTFLSDTKITYV